MGSFSIWHWAIVLAVILLMFGAGRVSSVMGDLGHGIKAFKKGLAEDDPSPAPDQAKLTAETDKLSEATFANTGRS